MHVGSDSIQIILEIIDQYYVNWGVVEGQPDSIVQDIENMIRSFIEKVIAIRVFKIPPSSEF
jgi:hypothetical protein